MRFFRAMALLAFSAGLLVFPTPTANAAVICPENGGGPFTLTLNGAPTPAGTVGVAYNQVLTTGAAIALVITGGTVAPGLSASVTGAFGDEIQISGTPSAAGSFNATVEIVHATQTVTCSWTFVVNAGGGGGGGDSLNPLLQSEIPSRVANSWIVRALHALQAPSQSLLREYESTSPKMG